MRARLDGRAASRTPSPSASRRPERPDGKSSGSAPSARGDTADVAGWPDPASAIVANIPTGSGAHGVAFGPKAGGGDYAYVSHEFENYVSVIDVATRTRAGDVPLVTTTTGKITLAGASDTGGNGISVRPNPPPWQ